jgi:hypothetical protein
VGLRAQSFASGMGCVPVRVVWCAVRGVGQLIVEVVRFRESLGAVGTLKGLKWEGQ